MNTLKAGEQAPQFTLLDQHEQPVSLSQFAGKKCWFIFIRKP
ncbi:thioredoxin-dependent thiol peroxidase [Actinobacillus equuli]|nr:thioredoxin-dependent thiol peroxidase [Actinobacillus equuli]